MLAKLRRKLLYMLSNGEPVLMNFYINFSCVKDGKFAVYIPADGKPISEDMRDMAVLTPLNSVDGYFIELG